MEAWQLELAAYLVRHYWAVLLLVCLWARAHWRDWTQKRYLGEALARLERVSSSRESALAERITHRLLKRFFHAPKPTLDSLANDIETPWKVKPSTGSFPKRDKST